MGIFDAIFNPSKNTNRAYGQASADFNATRGQTDPYYSGQLQGGMQANSMLYDLLGINGPGAQQQAMAAYSNSPDYEAQLAAGTQALDQSGAAAGMGRSGAQMKALQGYGQDLYNQGFQTRLGQLAGVGNTGAQGASGLMGNSGQFGNLAVGAGNAKDVGNQAGFGNIMGIAGTALGFASRFRSGGSGGGGFGRLFGGGNRAQPYTDPWRGMRG
jgi:hypothetical protein